MMMNAALSQTIKIKKVFKVDLVKDNAKVTLSRAENLTFFEKYFRNEIAASI